MVGKKAALAYKLRKAIPMLSAATIGGFSFALAILLGNWVVIVVVPGFLAIFRDEMRIIGRYVSIVFLIAVCPGWSREEKKQRISSQTELFIQVLGRDLVKKFLEREAL